MKLRRRHVFIYILAISFITLFVLFLSFDKWARNDTITYKNRDIIEKYLDDRSQKFLLENNIDVDLFIDFINEKNFVIENYEYYNLVAQYNHKLSNKEVVYYGNALMKDNFKLKFLTTNFENKVYSIEQLLSLASLSESLEKKGITIEYSPERHLALANATHYIDHYYPSDLVDINTKYTYKQEKIKIRKDTNASINQLCHRLSMFNNKPCGGFKIVNGFISYNQASKYHLDYLLPGYNSFQLGNTIEFEKNDKLVKEGLMLWLLDNIHEYGFVLRYPDQKVVNTGIETNKLIFSYVGKENAVKMVKDHLSIEEMN